MLCLRHGSGVNDIQAFVAARRYDDPTGAGEVGDRLLKEGCPVKRSLIAPQAQVDDRRLAHLGGFVEDELAPYRGQ